MKIHTIVIILLAIICNQAAMAGRAEEIEEINQKDIYNTNNSYYASANTKHLKVKLSEIYNSTMSIHLPKSVENVDITLGEIHSSAIILYSRHTPKINQNQHREIYSSSIKIMHPIRQYTYHLLALNAIVIAGLWIYTQ